MQQENVDPARSAPALDWSRMRLFVGIPLADAVVRELAALVLRLRPAAGDLRWAAPESWHITLQFLGNASEEQCQCLAMQLATVRTGPVPITLGELGCFDRAGVFFADIVVTRELANLQQHVIAATSRCGFVAETRPFHPHITLARAKGQGRGAELRGLKGKILSRPSFTRFTAHEFLLYESHPGARDARYEIRGRFPIAGPPY